MKGPRAPRTPKARPPADPLAAFPPQLQHSSERADRVYLRSAEFYVQRGANDPKQDPQAQAESGTVQTDDGVDLQVRAGRPGPDSGAVQPVYVEPGSGQQMIPSGRVFVRFAEGVAAESRREGLRAAGYRVLAIPSYAPHAAWVEAMDGDPAKSLAGLARLEALGQVANVEPQWLMRRSARAAPAANPG